MLYYWWVFPAWIKPACIFLYIMKRDSTGYPKIEQSSVGPTYPVGPDFCEH